LSIEIVTDRDIWDAFIDAGPSGLLFHKWDFLKITERHTGYRLLPCGIYRGRELVAVCPFFHRQRNGLSLAFSPPPMQAVIPYQGIVMSRDYTAAKQSKKESRLQLVIEGLREVIDDLSPNYLSIRLAPGYHRSDPPFHLGRLPDPDQLLLYHRSHSSPGDSLEEPEREAADEPPEV